MSEPIMQFFSYAHLPPGLQLVSKPFAELADQILTLPRNAERTVALRKLLESKDAAVRAALANPVEATLHLTFSDACVDGEWFRPVDELLELVRFLISLKEPTGA